MKREIFVYVDVFMDSKGNTNCNVMCQGIGFYLKGKILTEYVKDIDTIINEVAQTGNDEYEIYVDTRGIGKVMYGLLKEKYKEVYKLGFQKQAKLNHSLGISVEASPVHGVLNVNTNDMEKFIGVMRTVANTAIDEDKTKAHKANVDNFISDFIDKGKTVSTISSKNV